MCGVVFGDRIVPSFDKGQYFEVRVDEAEAGADDGLVLGVTMQDPQAVKETYEVANMVPDSWSVGYDGSIQIEGEEDMRGISWQPKLLKAGDRVGLLVRSCSIAVFQNGVQVEEVHCGNSPAGKPLYPLIDLLGGTSAVSLIIGAAPPGATLVAAPAPAAPAAAADSPSATLTQFNAALTGEYVTVSGGGWFSGATVIAKYIGPDKDGEACGVVYGDGPIASSTDGRYFEVTVDAVRDGPDDGLVVGVTTAYPKEIFDLAQQVPESWTFGYDGSAQMDGEDDMRPIEWQPKQLKTGDRVGLSVRGAAVEVFLNDKKVVSMACAVPEGRHLYPIVDLLGCTDGVTLNLSAVAPPAPSLQLHEKTLQNVTVTSHLRATYSGATREDMKGTIFGDSPVPIFSRGRYFEVKVEETEAEAEDGLVLGVTLENPEGIDIVDLDIAELVPRSWSFGYDGAAHLDGQDELVTISWQPKELKNGDRVGLLVDHDGAASIYVNNVNVTSQDKVMKCGIPVSVDLYPIIDLLGIVRAVSLQPGARPPPS
jgi:hypothetical protein